MDESGEAFMTSIPAGDHALVLVELSKQALDFPAPPITTQRSAVLASYTLATAPMWRDQFDAAGSQCLVERIAVIGTIPNKSSGSSHGEGFSEGSKDQG
jgi:hypothetical protein